MDIVYVHVTAINGKRGHDFEREQGGYIMKRGGKEEMYN